MPPPLSRSQTLANAIIDFAKWPVTTSLDPDLENFLKGAGIFDFPEINTRKISNVEFLEKMTSLLPGIIKAFFSDPAEPDGGNPCTHLYDEMKSSLAWLHKVEKEGDMEKGDAAQLIREKGEIEILNQLAQFLEWAGLAAQQHAGMAECQITYTNVFPVPKEKHALQKTKIYAEELSRKLLAYGAVCDKIAEDYNAIMTAAVMQRTRKRER